MVITISYQCSTLTCMTAIKVLPVLIGYGLLVWHSILQITAAIRRPRYGHDKPDIPRTGI